jgi:hypothetical protein
MLKGQEAAPLAYPIVWRLRLRTWNRRDRTLTRRRTGSKDASRATSLGHGDGEDRSRSLRLSEFQAGLESGLLLCGRQIVTRSALYQHARYEDDRPNLIQPSIGMFSA